MNARSSKIIIIQSNSSITNQFGPFFKQDGFEVSVLEGKTFDLSALSNGNHPDLVLMDSSLKEPEAIDLCRNIKTAQEYANIPILMLEVIQNGTHFMDAVDAGCDDLLTFPIHPTTLLLRVKSLLRINSALMNLDDSESVLYTLARTLEAKDQYTMGHADRVSGFAVELGKALGVEGRDLQTLRKGGMLHDVGKIAIPDAILTKPGKFSPEEFSIMKRHPVLGCEICGKLKSLQDAIPLIRHHHERLDGSGYPDRLQGNNVPALVRVVTIVDIYDALRSRRSYKEPFGLDKSFEIMWEEANKGWWDKNVLKTWEKVVRNGQINAIPGSA